MNIFPENSLIKEEDFYKTNTLLGRGEEIIESEVYRNNLLPLIFKKIVIYTPQLSKAYCSGDICGRIQG